MGPWARQVASPSPQAAGGRQQPGSCGYFPGHSASAADSEARVPGCREPRRSVPSPRVKGWPGFAAPGPACWGRRVRFRKERRPHVPGMRSSRTRAPSAKLPGGFPRVWPGDPNGDSRVTRAPEAARQRCFAASWAAAGRQPHRTRSNQADWRRFRRRLLSAGRGVCLGGCSRELWKTHFEREN